MSGFFKKLYQNIQKQFSYQEEEGESFIDSQRRHVFYYAIILVFGCIPLYMLVVTSCSMIYGIMNGLLLFFEIGFMLAFYRHKWSIEKTLAAMLMAVQLESGLEIIISSLNMVAYPRLLIMANMLLSLMFIMIAVCAFMDKVVNWLSIIPIICYSISAVVIEGPFLMKYAILTLVIILLANILGHIVYRNTIRMQAENTLLRKEEHKVLKSLNLSRDELFAFVELVSQKNSQEKTKNLIEAIGPKAKENLFSMLNTHLQTERTQMETIQQVFPELSASELTICQLILQDKTISEICEILFKSSGNITSQRTHIRTKLGLKKEENLKEALQKRLLTYYSME